MGEQNDPRGAILHGQNARRVVSISNGTVVLEGLDIIGGWTSVCTPRTPRDLRTLHRLLASVDMICFAGSSATE